jgi:formate dehydrogenase subunit gamma
MSRRGAGPSERVERFCKTTRWFHWTFALSFLALALTGCVLAFQEELGLGRACADLWLRAHLLCALFFAIGPALVVLSGDTRRWLADLSEAVALSRADLEWLARAPRALLGRAEQAPQGKLNAGQKLNALGVAALVGALVVSGVDLWLEPGAYVALLIHVSALIAWLPLFAVHFFMAVINPATRPALRSMWSGLVPRKWAAEHHARWLEEQEDAR